MKGSWYHQLPLRGLTFLCVLNWSSPALCLVWLICHHSRKKEIIYWNFLSSSQTVHLITKSLAKGRHWIGKIFASLYIMFLIFHKATQKASLFVVPSVARSRMGEASVVRIFSYGISLYFRNTDTVCLQCKTLRIYIWFTVSKFQINQISGSAKSNIWLEFDPPDCSSAWQRKYDWFAVLMGITI